LVTVEKHMSQLNLTSGQRQRLRSQLQQTRDVLLYRRTLAVLEFDQGRAVSDIARMLGVTRQSIYNWVEAYCQTRTPTALKDEPGRGRPPLLDEDDEHLLQALLASSPQDRGYPHTSWTVPLLQDALEFGTGRRPSDKTLRRTLRRLDYVWKRPRYVLDPDPELEKKKTLAQANQAVAAPDGLAGGGRDGPAAVPAVAGRLVQAR
jgi:transposase